jgi:hypothetical protein
MSYAPQGVTGLEDDDDDDDDMDGSVQLQAPALTPEQESPQPVWVFWKKEK